MFADIPAIYFKEAEMFPDIADRYLNNALFTSTTALVCSDDPLAILVRAQAASNCRLGCSTRPRNSTNLNNEDSTCGIFS